MAGDDPSLDLSRRGLLGGGAAVAAGAMLPTRLAAEESTCRVRSGLTPLKARPERAVSLRLVAEALEAGRPARFEGLTRLDGYALVEEERDIILWGLAELGKPELQVADFIVALRAAFVRGRRDGADYDKSAAISIDPDPDVFRGLKKFSIAETEGRRRYVDFCSSPQTVRVDGMPRHTRVAKILVDADYRMKMVGMGLVKLPISMPFPGDFEAKLEDWRAMLQRGSDDKIPTSVTRHWFTPGRFVHVVSADDSDTVFLEHAQVLLNDEDEVYEPGASKAVASGRINPYARAFSCAWTERMEDTYKAEPIWREMHNMFRHFAIARILADQNAFERVGLDREFLVDRFTLPRFEVPPTLSGLSRVETFRVNRGRVNSTYARSVCGGVQVGFGRRLEQTADNRGEIADAGRNVVAARPVRTAMAWPVAPDSLRNLVRSAPTPSSAPPGPALTKPAEPRSLQELFGVKPPVDRSPLDVSPLDKPLGAPSLRELFKT